MSEHTKGEMLAKPDLGNHLRWHLFIEGMSIARTSNWLYTDSQAEERANAKRIALTWNCHDELVGALEVWDSEKTESLSHLLRRIKHDLDSGNIIIEHGAYDLLMEVIEKQKAALAKVKDET